MNGAAAELTSESRSDLEIFSFRLESTNQNFDQMAHLVSTLWERHDHLVGLRQQLIDDKSKIVQNLGALGKQIHTIQAALGDLRESVDPGTPGMPEATAASETALGYVARLKTLVRDLRDKADQISVLNLDAASTVSINEQFDEKIMKSRSQLSSLETTVSGDSSKPWEKLTNLGDRLWVQYLDYVAGLSLRHEGLDRGVCYIADQMIKELQSYSNSLGALAIPGREDSVGTPPEIVYMRFPEWTVWAVPLAAHELWLLAVESEASIFQYFNYQAASELRGTVAYEKLADKSEPVRKPKSELTPLLADVFATFTIGPAYAWSALLLKLDPQNPEHRIRAQGILVALNRLNGNDMARPLKKDGTDLAGIWERAVKQAGGQVGTLSEDIEAWVQCLLKYLEKLQKLSFPTPAWVSRRDAWAESLQTGGPVEGEEYLSLRFTLNAAWKARLEHPESAEAIAKRCYDLCRKLANRSAPTANSPRDNAAKKEWLSAS